MDILIFKGPENEGGGFLLAFFGGFMLIDLPFSFVLDTALLPITTPWAIYDKSTDDPLADRTNHPCHMDSALREIKQGTAKIKEIVHVGPYELKGQPEVVYTIADFPSSIWIVDVFGWYTNGTLVMVKEPLTCRSSDPEVFQIEENPRGENGCAVRFLKPGKGSLTVEYGSLRYTKDFVVRLQQDDDRIP